MCIINYCLLICMFVLYTANKKVACSNHFKMVWHYRSLTVIWIEINPIILQSATWIDLQSDACHHK